MSDRNDDNGLETWVGESFFQLRNIEVAHPTTAQSTFSSSQTEMLCGYGYINFSMLFSRLPAVSSNVQYRKDR